MEPSNNQHHRRPNYGRWAAFIFLVILVAAALLLACPHQVLTVDTGPVRAQALVVLGGGDNSERARYAAQLYKEGEAPWVICSGQGDCDANRDVLEKNGVPATAISEEPRSRTTSENARFSLPLLRQRGATNIIIVTSWYHSRRAWHCFHHYAPDLIFYSRPANPPPPLAVAQQKQLRRHILFEYIKSPGYWVRYGVSPL